MASRGLEQIYESRGLLAIVYSKSFRILLNRILAFFLSLPLAKMSTDAKKKWIKIEP
jgi:hypothetical protein